MSIVGSRSQTREELSEDVPVNTSLRGLDNASQQRESVSVSLYKVVSATALPTYHNNDSQLLPTRLSCDGPELAISSPSSTSSLGSEVRVSLDELDAVIATFDEVIRGQQNTNASINSPAAPSCRVTVQTDHFEDELLSFHHDYGDDYMATLRIPSKHSVKQGFQPKVGNKASKKESGHAAPVSDFPPPPPELFEQETFVLPPPPPPPPSASPAPMIPQPVSSAVTDSCAMNESQLRSIQEDKQKVVSPQQPVPAPSASSPTGPAPSEVVVPRLPSSGTMTLGRPSSVRPSVPRRAPSTRLSSVVSITDGTDSSSQLTPSPQGVGSPTASATASPTAGMARPADPNTQKLPPCSHQPTLSTSPSPEIDTTSQSVSQIISKLRQSSITSGQPVKTADTGASSDEATLDQPAEGRLPTPPPPPVALDEVTQPVEKSECSPSVQELARSFAAAAAAASMVQQPVVRPKPDAPVRVFSQPSNSPVTPMLYAPDARSRPATAVMTPLVLAAKADPSCALRRLHSVATPLSPGDDLPSAVTATPRPLSSLSSFGMNLETRHYNNNECGTTAAVRCTSQLYYPSSVASASEVLASVSPIHRTPAHTGNVIGSPVHTQSNMTPPSSPVYPPAPTQRTQPVRQDTVARQSIIEDKASNGTLPYATGTSNSIQALRISATTLAALQHFGVTDIGQIPGCCSIPTNLPEWKVHMLDRKNCEAAETYANDLQQWGHVPNWKRELIEKKRRELETVLETTSAVDKKVDTGASSELAAKLRRRREKSSPE